MTTAMKIWDCIIIGGGPAGQSAAIYLARFNRSVLVIDRGTSRTNSYELNENYLGFINGIPARQLAKIGKTQAEHHGAIFVADEVVSLSQASNPDPAHARFACQGLADTYYSRTVMIATGVTDLYPNLPHYKDYLGKSLFWCITCDGPKTRNQKLVVIGDTDDAACTALQFKLYTSTITLVTNYAAGTAKLSPTWLKNLADHDVKIWEGEISHLNGQDGMVNSLSMKDGREVSCTVVMNLQGAIPNTALATQIDITINAEGYIETDDEQRTSVPFAYAIGDVTRRFSHQIITAAHEGSMAAQACNYDLYESWQRL